MQTVKLFKRTAALFAAIAVAAVSAAVAAFADGAPLGSGTEADPYIIRTGAELVEIGGSEGGVGYITLANDIDLSAYQGQTCIIKKLTGKLDGAGHKITGLNLKGKEGVKEGWSYVSSHTGLIDELSGSVENLTISDAVITDAAKWNYVGVLAAYIPEGSEAYINNCTVTGKIEGPTTSTSYLYIGALVGYADGVKNSGTTVSFNRCVSNVNNTCSGAANSGGLMGAISPYVTLNVSCCAVLGNVAASSSACGILGYYSSTSIELNISNSYFGGKLNGATNKLGIAYNKKLPDKYASNNFFFDTEKNKGINAFYYKDVPGASGVTTAEIMALASTLDGFEASDEFGGYPVPKQQTAAAFSVTVDESNVNVTAAKAGSYSLVLASYFGDALADVKIQTVTFTNDGDGQTVSVPDGFTADGRTFRAMLWSGMCPLAKSNN